MKDNWVKIPLGEVCNSYAGGTPNRSMQGYYGGNIPWISSGEVNKDFIDETNEYITDLGLKFSSAKWIPKDSVLVAMYGATAGQVSKLKIDATSNQAVLALIPTEVDKDYLFYILNQSKENILYLAQGSGQPNLSKSLLDKTEINLPPLPQQKKIAKILSTCDAVIEKTEAAIAKYQDIKQGMMHDLFTRGIDLTTGKLRPTPEQAPDLYKDSELGKIPKDWEVKGFGEHINFLGGFPFSSTFFNEEKKGVPLIRIRDLLTSSQETYYNGDYLETYLINEGDVLIGMDGDFHIVKWKNSPSLLNQRILKIEEKYESNIHLDYFYYYLMPFLLDVHNKTAATTVKHLSVKDISGAMRFMPSKAEQIMCANKILSLERKILLDISFLNKHKKIKSGLMQDLLTGKVEVKN